MNINEQKIAEASFEIKTLMTLIKNSASFANLKIVPSLCSFEKTIVEAISQYSDFQQNISEFDAKFQERLSDKLKQPDFANKYYTFFNELDKSNLTEEQLAAFNFELAGYNSIVLENELQILRSRKENGETLSKAEYDKIEFLEQQLKVNDLEQQLFYTYDKNNPDYIVLYNEYTKEKQNLIKISYKPIHEELSLKKTELIGLTGDEREQLLYEIYELEMSCKQEQIELKTLELKPDLTLTYDTTKIPKDHEYWKIYGNTEVKSRLVKGHVVVQKNNHIDVEEYNKEKKKEIAVLQQEYADLGVKVYQNKKDICENIIKSPYYTNEQKIIYQNMYDSMDLIIKDCNNIKEKAILEEKKQNYDSESYDYKKLTEQQIDLDIKFITENYYKGVPEKKYQEQIEVLEWKKENIADFIDSEVNATTNSCFDNFSYIEHEYIQELLDIKEFNEMNAWAKTSEGAETFLNSFVTGAGNVLEQYYDGVIMLGGGAAGLFNDDISARAGYFVSRDLSGEAYDESVKYLNQGIAYGACHEVGDFTGSLIVESAVITAYALASAYCPVLNGGRGAALAFGVKGMGKGSENALNSGASFGAAYWAGAATGAVDTANAYLLYSPKGFTPDKLQKVYIAYQKEFLNEGITAVYDGEFDVVDAAISGAISGGATLLSEYAFKPLATKKITGVEINTTRNPNGETLASAKFKIETNSVKTARSDVKKYIEEKVKEQSFKVSEKMIERTPTIVAEEVSKTTEMTLDKIVVYSVDRTVQKGLKDGVKDITKNVVEEALNN